MVTAVQPEPKQEERRIDPEMSVREINARYPSCRAVFAQHGMGGCGGDLGPEKTVPPFVSLEQATHVHGLAVDRAVERLRAALGPAVARASQQVQLKEKAS